MTLTELNPLIIEWAKKRDLIKPENAEAQRSKILEEVGEAANALKNMIR